MVLEDLKRGLEKITDGNRNTALPVNEDKAYHRSILLLYARCVCFRVFLESAAATGEITDNHRELWVLIQVAPVTLLGEYVVLLRNSDIFFACTQLAGRASTIYLDNAIRDELIVIEQHLPRRSTLFCVLDEAQALTKDLNYFRSKKHPEQGRPILRAILRSWDPKFPNLIVSGTGISMHEVEDVIGSVVAKELEDPVPFDMVTEIGGFDDEDGQLAYLNQYLPPGYLDTSQGKEIASRVGYWLRGRFVLMLLSDKRLLIKSIDIVLLQLTSHALSGPATSAPMKY